MRQPGGKLRIRAFLYSLAVPSVPWPLWGSLGAAVQETLPLRTGRSHDTILAPSIGWHFGELLLFF